MKFTLNFGKHDYTGNGIKDNLVEVEVELKEKESNRGLHFCPSCNSLDETFPQVSLSITGSIWNRIKTDCISAGQNLDEIRKLIGENPLMERVHFIWKRYHLNDMTIGSPRQEACIAGYKQANPDWEWFYGDAIRILMKAGLHPDTQHNDYRYGSSWLYTPIPDDILAEIETWKEE